MIFSLKLSTLYFNTLDDTVFLSHKQEYLRVRISQRQENPLKLLQVLTREYDLLSRLFFHTEVGIMFQLFQIKLFLLSSPVNLNHIRIVYGENSKQKLFYKCVETSSANNIPKVPIPR